MQAKIKKKLESISSIRRKCDKLWREHIKRDKECFFNDLGECLSGEKYHFEAAHLIGRKQSLRVIYHPLNGVCACPRHHAMLDGKSKGAGLCWQEILTRLPGRYEYLLRISNNKRPMKRLDWELVYTELSKL